MKEIEEVIQDAYSRFLDRVGTKNYGMVFNLVNLEILDRINQLDLDKELLLKRDRFKLSRNCINIYVFRGSQGFFNGCYLHYSPLKKRVTGRITYIDPGDFETDWGWNYSIPISLRVQPLIFQEYYYIYAA